MKYTEARPYADPEKAARRIVEIASTVEPVQDGRIHVELINGPFLFKDKGSPAEYGAGITLPLERGGSRRTRAVLSCGSPGWRRAVRLSLALHNFRAMN